MKEIKVNTQSSFPIPAGATNLTITHAWGDTVKVEIGLTPGDTYQFTPDSIGVHKFVWSDGSAVISTQFFSVVLPYLSSSEFFTEFPDLETEDESFAPYERRVRHIIETFTQQEFGPYVGKTLELEGDGGDSLEVPVRLMALTSVGDLWGTDYSPMVGLAGDGWFLEFAGDTTIPRTNIYGYNYDVKRDIVRYGRDRFDHGNTYVIHGNWGYEYVPNAVVDAAKLLLVDEFAGSNDMRRAGINQAQLGDFSYKLNADQWGTTGNVQADMLLSPYVMIRIGHT